MYTYTQYEPIYINRIESELKRRTFQFISIYKYR